MKKRVIAIEIIITLLIICIVSCPILAQDIPNNVITNTSTNETNNINLQTNDINELQTMHNEVQGQVTEANDQLNEVQSGLSEIMQQIQELNERIDGYQSEIEKLGTEAEKLKTSIDRLEAELEVAEKNYEKQKKTLETRLVVLYEAGETTYLDVLLNSKGIEDFISKYYLITQIVAHDQELLEKAELEKIQIEVAKTTLDEQRKKYKIAKDNTEKTAIILENTKVVKNNYMNKLSAEELELQQKIDTYNQQIKDIEAEILMLTTANVGSDYVGGSMNWPVPGYTRISSPFGMRVHPITGINKLHTGTDISAPMGVNFIAANSGVVVKAGPNAAYGNMVIIDHGGGVSTLYAHGSEILVSVGQYVNRGEPVLKVGSTGYSTGPHAHFEVRINGEYVDPMNFVRPD